MGMTAGMRRVSANELETLLALEAPVLEWDENGSGQYWGESEPSLQLDKASNGLHYLLTQTGHAGEEPWCYLLLGGKVVSGGETGYERLLVPAEVAAFDEALSSLSPDDLRQRFNPQEMMAQDVYPSIWDRDPDKQDTLGWLLEFYDELREFVRETAANNQAIIIDLSV